MPIFRARFKGTCRKCGGLVSVGELVSWSRRARGIVYHARCAEGEGQGESQGKSRGESQGGDPQQGQGQGQGHEQQQQRQQDTSQGQGPRPQVDEAEVKRIAREVAQEEDLSNLQKIREIIDTRIKKLVPSRVTIVRREPSGGEEHEEVENVHHEFAKLLYLVGKGEHVYLYGPPGSGKSTGAVQAARALKRRYGYISLNPQTPESRLLGFIDAGGLYRETEFFRCYTQGGVFCIDELDNGHPALLNTLNGMLETDDTGVGRGAFPCGVVERHPDFVAVCTGNTNGRGADKLFPERRALDAAFLERFAFLAWGYDEALETAIMLGINEHAGHWLIWIRQVRQYVAEHGIRMWASPRASFKGAAMLIDSAWDMRTIADTVLFKGLDADTVSRVLHSCPLPQAGT